MTNKAYKVNKTLNCNDGGIYVETGSCGQQYSGKTTTPYSNRTYKHFTTSSNQLGLQKAALLSLTTSMAITLPRKHVVVIF